MPVDSFKYLPRIIAAIYQTTSNKPDLPIPWTPLHHPVSETWFGLVTSGGLYHQGLELPFNLEGERKEPTWGDPTFRTIPIDILQEELKASHLHINTQHVQEDFNVLLPIHRFQELAQEECIGGLVDHAYSFMGYQGYPPDTTAWREIYGLQVAERLKNEGANCVLLTPS